MAFLLSVYKNKKRKPKLALFFVRSIEGGHFLLGGFAMVELLHQHHRALAAIDRWAVGKTILFVSHESLLPGAEKIEL